MKKNKLTQKRGGVGEATALRFCGSPVNEFEKAEVVFIPVPYDSTTTYKSGSREGPLALLLASLQLDEPWGEFEKWHPAVEEGFFYTFEHFIYPEGSSTKEQLESVSTFISKEAVSKGKIPFILGGEHSLTYSALNALYKKHKDFSILYFDAHTDLRPSYHGDPYSHSAVLRRCFEMGSKISATLVGVRSVDRDVAKFIAEWQDKNSRSKSLNVFYAPAVPIKDIENTLKEKVYLSFDLDVFDHSIMPAVGTPQPGGLGWYQVLNLISYVIARHEIIGVDVVELAPLPGMVAPDFAAAKLCWKILENLYDKRKRDYRVEISIV